MYMTSKLSDPIVVVMYFSVVNIIISFSARIVKLDLSLSNALHKNYSKLLCSVALALSHIECL